MSELDIKSEPGVDKPLILGTAHTVTIDNITPVKPGIDSPVLAGNAPLPEPKHGKDKRKRCNNSNSSISDTSSGSPGLVKQTKKKSKVKTDKWIPNMITLKRRGITALTVMADKASKQFTRQMKKLSNQQLEAAPNLQAKASATVRLFGGDSSHTPFFDWQSFQGNILYPLAIIHMVYINVLDFDDKFERDLCFSIGNLGIIFNSASAQLFPPREKW